MLGLAKRIDRVLSGWPPWRVIAYALALVAMLGSLDYVSGYEMSFSVFYLIPISLATWYVSGRCGFVICVISASTWLLVDHTSGHVYSQRWIPFWNAGVRFTFFTLITYLMSEVHRHLDNERRFARQDHLTGLRNSMAFHEEAELLLANAERQGHPSALGFMDLDRLKRINDTLGHAEGSRVLQCVGQKVLGLTRRGDLIGRFGGDEFVVLLSHTDLEGARRYFDRLHATLNDAMRVEGWDVGFSIGVVVFTGAIPAIDEAIRRADLLMYRAKNEGRNRVLYEEDSAAASPPQAARRAAGAIG